jgi:hypothetical protein
MVVVIVVVGPGLRQQVRAEHQASGTSRRVQEVTPGQGEVFPV